MATGIVSAALLDASHPHLSAGLLGVAAAAFAILAAASALRAAAFPALLRDDLACPARAFTCFAFVAACDVLGDRLAADGHDAAALALAGAASITVLAAAQILGGPRSPALSAARTGLTAAAVAFWVLATGLIPLLAGRSAWRHLFRRQPLRYRSDLWMVVFPAGMYATASMRLGMVAGLPLIHAVGAVAAWPAAAAWAVTFTAMLAAPAAARSRARSAGPAGPRGPSPPARRSRRSRRNRRQLTS